MPYETYPDRCFCNNWDTAPESILIFVFAGYKIFALRSACGCSFPGAHLVSHRYSELQAPLAGDAADSLLSRAVIVQ